MAHQDVTNTLKVEVRYTMAGTNAENVFHVLTDGPPTDAEVESVRGIFQAWILSDWAPIAAEAWSCQEIVITDLTSLTGIRRSYPFATPAPGLNTSQAMPANCTIAVKADIGTRGRGKNGRVFWVGLAEDEVNGNALLATTATSILAGLTNLKNLIEAVVPLVGLCIPHLVVNGIRPPVCTSSVVQGFALADNIMDSQRDRLPGHKRHKRRTP